MGNDTWDTVDALTAWLDAHRNGDGPDRTALLRILKLSEEVGEVAEAVIGATGGNPRKGTGHTWDDVRSELCDVVVTGMVALRTLTPDASDVFAAHLLGVARRAGLSPGGPCAAVEEEVADEVRVLDSRTEDACSSLAHRDRPAYCDPHGLDSAEYY